MREKASIGKIPVVAVRDGLARPVCDRVAVEEPLEMRLGGLSVAVTMRTPGHDFELTAGFLFTEGIIRSAQDISSIGHCETDDIESAGNIVNVNPIDAALADPVRWQRNFLATSSCGICGKSSIETIRQQVSPVPGCRVSADTLGRLPEQLDRSQQVFRETGGLHAAALFTLGGELMLAREDVGRHNAVDKIVGSALLDDSLPLESSILFVSSRASFEIVQKALKAGIPVIATVSAPSTLAITLAQSMNVILVGFLRPMGSRGYRFNAYSGHDRIDGLVEEPIEV